VLWDAIRAVRPDLYRGFNPWDRISDPEAVMSLLTSAGIEHPVVVAEAGTHPLRSPEDWWPMVMGSGYRGTLDQLDETARDWVRERTLARLRDFGLRSVEANVVYAVARATS
jgi:hypothetical protein